jgi:uncharacterized protein
MLLSFSACFYYSKDMSLLMPLTIRQFRNVAAVLTGMYVTSRILENKNYIQHGSTTTYNHCRNVAYVSLQLASTFHWHIDEHALIRGALLHDYYLYDWHNHQTRLHLHGFRHPALALANAEQTYILSPVEIDIIKHHMFPLTLFPPKTKEGFLICLSDKLCSLYETFKLNERHVEYRRQSCSKASAGI